MKAIWQMWESELSDEKINEIIKECELYNPVEAQTGLGADGQVNSHIRRSIVRWIDPLDEGSKFISNLFFIGIELTQSFY